MARAENDGESVVWLLMWDNGACCSRFEEQRERMAMARAEGDGESGERWRERCLVVDVG